MATTSAIASGSKFSQSQGEYFTTEETAKKIADFLLNGDEQLLLYETESFLKFSIGEVLYRMKPSSKDELVKLVQKQFYPPRLPIKFEEENTSVSSMPFDEKCTLVGRFFFRDHEQVAQDVAELACKVLEEGREVEVSFNEGLAIVCLNGKVHKVDMRGGLIQKIEKLSLEHLGLTCSKTTSFSAGLNPVSVIRLKPNTLRTKG